MKVQILKSRIFLGALSISLALAAWQFVGMRTNPLFFSTPMAVLRAAPLAFSRDHLMDLYANTMAVFVVALVGTVAAGIAFGVLTGLNMPARHFFDPIVMLLYSTPALALIPVFVLWFGIGSIPKVALVFLAAFFPMIINVQLGIDELGPHMNELGRSFGANRWEMLSKIVLPAILPYMLSGVRIAVPRAFVAVIAAEMLVTAQGVGGLVLRYGNQYQTDFYFVPVLLLVATSYVLTEGVKALEHLLTPWRRAWSD